MTDDKDWNDILREQGAERAQMWSDRVANIIAATRAGELLERAYDNPQDWRCRICPHAKRCWGQI